MKHNKKVIAIPIALGVIVWVGWGLYNKFLENRFKQAVASAAQQSFSQKLNQEIYKIFPNEELKNQVLQAAMSAGTLEYHRAGIDGAGNEIVQYKFKAPSRDAIAEVSPMAIKAQGEGKEMSVEQIRAFFKERSKDQNLWKESIDQVVLENHEGTWRAIERH